MNLCFFFFFSYFGSVDIQFLSCNLVIFFDDYESDPLSPPEGEATQGERPLDSQVEFSLTLCQPFLYEGCPNGEGGGIRCRSPQERSIIKTYDFP